MSSMSFWIVFTFTETVFGNGLLGNAIGGSAYIPLLVRGLGTGLGGV